jgi:hypothetical protein
VKSKDEAIEWLKRARFDDTKLRFVRCSKRKICAELTPKLREQEERLRKQVAEKT